MVFSNSFFLFGFLPVTIVVYYLLFWSRRLQNLWLVVVSLAFYAWGEPKFVVLIIASIVMNYLFGIAVHCWREKDLIARITLVCMLLYNIGVLFLFKYLHFTLDIFHIESVTWDVALPIGISFYTFQAISYVIDVYRGDGEVQYNPFYVALYIAFFPQLIAGPIVRYQTIADQIRYRKESLAGVQRGVKRFLIGLTKKLMFANAFAVFADYSFAHVQELSVLSAWIGAIAYTLQIYFDFSGYSDMAIGLGNMFGFQFLENFHYPYLSKSVSDFWRRWHISLGSWFRDYVYIPLGGSRVKTTFRRIGNLFIVWLLTGIWHGANWTFLLWGLFNFVFLLFEKTTNIPERLSGHGGRMVYRVITLVCIVFGWVLFRASSVTEAILYMRHMLLPVSEYGMVDTLATFWLRDLKILAPIGILCSTPIPKRLTDYLGKQLPDTLLQILASVCYLVLFLFCIGYSVNGSYDPFIYFNF